MKTIAESEAILPDEQLRMMKIAKGGTWYSDDYLPYCVHFTKQCSSPRMVKTKYGFRCPDCGDMIGWDFKRLVESPLNKIKSQQ